MAAKRRMKPHAPIANPYGFVAIEGNIGAGKTTFATWLAEQTASELMLEEFEENPFLEPFYTDPERYALSVELTFLSDRYRQHKETLEKRNLFKPGLVADYSFAKSSIFAKANLPAPEFRLFNTMFKLMDEKMPKPEVIAILDPNRRKIRDQIIQRGRSYEQGLSDDYLDKVAYGYHKHYKYARGSRVLWIDTSGIDFVARPEEAFKLAEAVLAPRKPGVYEIELKG